jgi:hypothetical protein
LSSGNFPFRCSAQGPLSLSSRPSSGWRTEDRAQLFVQIIDLFFDCRSPFELANCKVVYVHTISKSSKSDQIKRLDTRGITIAQVELDSEHVTQNHYQMFVTLYGKTLETTLPDHYHRSACDNDLHGSSIATV